MSAYRDGFDAARRGWNVHLLASLDLPLRERLLWRVGYWRGGRGGL